MYFHVMTSLWLVYSFVPDISDRKCFGSCLIIIPDSKVHVAHMGPTWVLSAPGRPHVGPMNLALSDDNSSSSFQTHFTHVCHHIICNQSSWSCFLFFFTDSNFVLGNAQAAGHPIVYCSDGFCELTGFMRAQVMSKSCACKFLYGPDTAEEEKQKIENAVDMQVELKTEVQFKRKNGEYRSSLLMDSVHLFTKMTQPNRYRNPHYKPKMVWQLPYNGNPYSLNSLRPSDAYMCQ